MSPGRARGPGRRSKRCRAAATVFKCARFCPAGRSRRRSAKYEEALVSCNDGSPRSPAAPPRRSRSRRTAADAGGGAAAGPAARCSNSRSAGGPQADARRGRLVATAGGARPRTAEPLRRLAGVRSSRAVEARRGAAGALRLAREPASSAASLARACAPLLERCDPSRWSRRPGMLLLPAPSGCSIRARCRCPGRGRGGAGPYRGAGLRQEGSPSSAKRTSPPTGKCCNLRTLSLTDGCSSQSRSPRRKGSAHLFGRAHGTREDGDTINRVTLAVSAPDRRE